MNDHAGMQFEWDDAKSNACFEPRGFDFAYVLQFLWTPSGWFARTIAGIMAKTALNSPVR
jgi:uncharacterized DUF497 family protein